MCDAAFVDARPTVGFSHFVKNQTDGAYVISDALVHEECLERNFLPPALAAIMMSTVPELRHGRGKCLSCSLDVKMADVFAGFLTSDPSDPLFPLNWARLHRACVPASEHAGLLGDLAKRTADRARWLGPQFDINVPGGWRMELNYVPNDQRVRIVSTPKGAKRT